MWNSIIIFILPMILVLTTGLSFGLIIGLPGALLYYYINKWLFVDYMNLGVSTNHQAESTTKFKCSLCGAICDEDETEEESET